MPFTSVVPVPETVDNEPNTEDKRLWIGNLDPHVTEYQLLKLLQKFGGIEKFDLLFHKTGPLAGQPRGYAFVTYVKRGDAQIMMDTINGQLFGSKNVAVRWAHTMNKTEIEKPKVDLKIPALVGAKEETKLSREIQIQAIESKLKMMEHNSVDELLFPNQQPSTSSMTDLVPIRTSAQAKKALPFRNKSCWRNRILPYNKR